MLLYANGDSHTAPRSYIDIIGEEFAFEFVNQAQGGCSNASIIRRTRDYLKHTIPDLVIIGWSTWEREEWEQDGKLVSGTRLQYFDACYINERFKFTRPSLYQLQPRTKGIPDRDWAGWKGMTFHDQPKLEKTASGRLISPNEVFWFDVK